MIYQEYFKSYMKEFNALDRKFWNYEDGCVLIGTQAMYEATGNRYYLESIKNFIDRYVKEDGMILYYDPQEYNIDRIPSGRVLYLLYKEFHKENYRKALELLMGQLRTHPRTECGNFWHKKIYPYQIWLDGLYMGIPFYMMYERDFEDWKNIDDIMNQFENTRKYLYDEKTGLYYHAYDEKKQIFWADKKTGLSKNFWSRALGWYLMALADCYELLPEKFTNQKKRLAELWKEALDGMLSWQDEETGLFYQLTALKNEPGNYLETSSSVMVAYSVMKGCRLGVLDTVSYFPKAEKIMISIACNMFKLENGKLKLTGMCKGAGLGPADNLRRDGSVAYYLAEDVVCDEQKGAGACMMAYAEWLKCAREGLPEKTEYPEIEIFNRAY